MTLAIIMEGGLIQAVVTDDPAMIGQTVTVIDYDVDGAEQVKIIPQSFGADQPARVWIEGIEKSGIDLAALEKQAPVETLCD